MLFAIFLQFYVLLVSHLRLVFCFINELLGEWIWANTKQMHQKSPLIRSFVNVNANFYYWFKQKAYGIYCRHFDCTLWQKKTEQLLTNYFRRPQKPTWNNHVATTNHKQRVVMEIKFDVNLLFVEKTLLGLWLEKGMTFSKHLLIEHGTQCHTREKTQWVRNFKSKYMQKYGVTKRKTNNNNTHFIKELSVHTTSVMMREWIRYTYRDIYLFQQKKGVVVVGRGLKFKFFPLASLSLPFFVDASTLTYANKKKAKQARVPHLRKFFNETIKAVSKRFDRREIKNKTKTASNNNKSSKMSDTLSLSSTLYCGFLLLVFNAENIRFVQKSKHKQRIERPK